MEDVCGRNGLMEDVSSMTEEPWLKHLDHAQILHSNMPEDLKTWADVEMCNSESKYVANVVLSGLQCKQ